MQPKRVSDLIHYLFEATWTKRQTVSIVNWCDLNIFVKVTSSDNLNKMANLSKSYLNKVMRKSGR